MAHRRRFSSLEELNRAIVSCSLCPRLVRYREEVAGSNPRYRGEKYWSRPLPGFGDPRAEIVIVGLAPAAHGGNRTGRMFTGDESGNNLARALYEAGLASQPYSISRDDGLVLRRAYITASLRCAPPGNRPLASELSNCLPYLEEEIVLLVNARVFVALGRIAWHQTIKALSRALSASIRDPGFRHGARVTAESSRGTIALLASYHPSPRNMRTGLLTHEMLVGVLLEAIRLADRLRRVIPRG